MKALTERLEWVRLYLTGKIEGETAKKIAMDELNAAIVISEVLPEISVFHMPNAVGVSMPAEKVPPERIITLPDEKG